MIASLKYVVTYLFNKLPMFAGSLCHQKLDGRKPNPHYRGKLLTDPFQDIAYLALPILVTSCAVAVTIHRWFCWGFGSTKLCTQKGMIWCKDSPFCKFGRNSLEKDWLGIRQSSQLAPPFFCLFDLLHGKISWFWMSLMMTESFFFFQNMGLSDMMGWIWIRKEYGFHMVWASTFHAFKVGFFRLTHGENMSFCEELLTVQRFLQSRCSLATNLQFGAHGMHKQCECCGTKDGVAGPLIGSLRGQWWFPARELQEDNDNKFKALDLFCLVPVCMFGSQGKKVSCWVMVFESSLVLEVLGTAFDHHIWSCFYEFFSFFKIGFQAKCGWS